ncbi:hypothetical protein [Leptolyngbya sp. CCY15150]|uniref:hypothetical protein n=1 Tax=Leptolyngbya sp. CCY15150 TaxID=2767772 RepID=UPI00195037F0|nr:hypothetical protein [Leptolyngbya sp. CCY15150]
MTDVLLTQAPTTTAATDSLMATVLRFPTPVLEGLDGRSPTLPEPVAQTLDALVTMVAQLQTTDSGWPSDLPQTPETLAPYVAEEIDRVLEAWSHAPPKPTPSILEAIAPSGLPQQTSHYIDVDTWRSRLLWAVVRGSAIAMQWMEGLEATVVLSPDAAPIQGQVRLVPYGILTLEQTIAFDLTTQQQPSPLLDASVLLQSQTPDSQGLEQTPCSVENLLALLLDGLQVTTPRLKPLLDGQRVDILQPEQTWQRGHIQLQFGFEFIPHSPAPSDTSPLDPTLLAPTPSDTADIPSPPTTAGQPTPTQCAVQEPERTALIAAVIAHQRQEAIAHRAEAWQAIAQMPTVQSIGDWAYQACQVTETLRHPALTYHSMLLHQAIPVYQWQRWLLWQISRSAYPVMQLLGGISVQVLQPGTAWQSGTLHLWAGLHLKTETQDLLLDLTTGQAQDQPHSAIHPDAIARPRCLGWNAELLSIESLQKAVLEQCYHTPLLDQLRSPLPVDLWNAESDRPTPATLQLDLQLEFWDIPPR